MGYEQPNQDNVQIGDSILQIHNEAVNYIPVTEITELSARTFHNNEEGEPVWGIHPYITAVIFKKQNGTFLVGEKVLESELAKILNRI